MAQILGFPRLCLESLILKDSSVFVGTVEFRNCVRFTHGGTLKGDLIMNDEVCIDEFCNVVNNGNPNQLKYPKGYMCGFEMSYVNSNTVSLQAGACRDYNDSYNICTTNPLTIDITVSGAGGLDFGTENFIDWYAVHVIADSTGINAPVGLLSLSASPSLPVGYDVFRRVGWVRNSLGNFIPFKQSGKDKDRKYCYDNFVLFNIVLAGGTASQWTTVSLSNRVPPTSCYVYLQANFNSSDPGDDWAFRTTGSAYGSPVGNIPSPLERAYAPQNVQLGFTTGPFIFNEARKQMEMCTGVNQQIDYASDLSFPGFGFGVDLFVIGFDDVI